MSEVWVEPLAKFSSAPVEWLWPGRIAIGKLTLIAGDPGLGKSFITLDIAARLSVGAAWPDAPNAHPPSGTIVLSAEDDPGDTIRPRIEAAGGDVARIGFVNGIDRPGAGTLGEVNLDEDCAALKAAVRKMAGGGSGGSGEGRGAGGCKLVIVDPISAYMGEADSNNNAQVRAVLRQLASLAQSERVAVVAVTHLSKSSGAEKTKAVYRAMGSLAFTAAARCVWAVGVHPEDPKARIMALVKMNLGGVGGPIGFAVKSPEGFVQWSDAPAELTADALEDRELSEEQVGVGEAVRFLRETLANGPVAAGEVIAAAKAAGIADRTLRRARGAAGVETGRAPGGDPKRPWVWRVGGRVGGGQEGQKS